MGGNKEAFFDTVFNLRFYSRLMSTLRLNTFSFPCSLDQPLVRSPTPTSPGPAAVGAVSQSAQAADSGCCSEDGTAAPAACGTDSSCGSSIGKAGEAPGGTVLYALASHANHDCDPSLEVQVGAGAGLTLRTRREIRPGEEVTVTYLDSSLDVGIRQAKLRLYGFECRCALCVRQLAEARAKGVRVQAQEHFTGQKGAYRGEFDA